MSVKNKAPYITGTYPVDDASFSLNVNKINRRINIDFQYQKASDIKVFGLDENKILIPISMADDAISEPSVDNASDGSYGTLTLPAMVDVPVSPATDPVTFISTLASSIYEKYVIVRKTDLEFLQQFITGGEFWAEQITNALDKLSLVVQENADKGDNPIYGLLEIRKEFEKIRPLFKDLPDASDPLTKSIKSIYETIITKNTETAQNAATIKEYLTAIKNIKAAIVAITGHDTDPTTVHNVYSLENLVKLMKTYVYGQEHTWDWDTSTYNQYYRDLRNDPLYPQIDNLKPVFKAYVLRRYNAEDTIFANTVIINPVLLRELQLVGVKKDKDGNFVSGANLEVITRKYLDTWTNKLSVLYGILAQNIGKYTLTDNYTCVGNEVKPDGNGELVKLFEFTDPPNASGIYPIVEPNKSTEKFRVWGEDIKADGFQIAFDASDLDADFNGFTTAMGKSGVEPIITFEMDFAGAKDYNFLTGKSADEAEASVHGRYIEFNIGVDGDGNPAFTDGHFTVQKSKDLGLTALAKGTKYTFNVRDIPLISHWLPEHLIPSDGKNFFQTVILKTADIGVNDRYIQQDFDDKKIPDNRKVGDVKLEAKSKASDGAILDISSFPIVDFTPEFNGIHTITFEELSVKWFQDKMQELKDLSEKYAEGFTFPVSKTTSVRYDFSGNKTEHLEAEISNELVRLDGNTDRISLLKQETAVFKGEFTPANNANPSVQLVPLNNAQRAAQLNLNPPAQTPINEWLDINGHSDGNILEADYTASEAGTLVVTVTLKGSKQYRDELSEKLKNIAQDVEDAITAKIATTVTDLNTAVTDATSAKTDAETAKTDAETAQGAAETAQGKAETAQGAAAISAAASDISARSSRAASLAGGGWADHRDLSTDDLTHPAGVGTQEYQFVIPDINLVQYFVDTSKARLDLAGRANLTEFIMDLPDPVAAVPVTGGDDEGQIFSVMIVKKNEDGIPIKVYPEGTNVTIDGKDKVGGFVVPYDIANNAYVLTIQLERNADGTRKKDTNNVDIPDNWKVISLGGGGPKVDLSLYATKNKSKTVIRGNTFLGKYFESIDRGVTLDVWDDNKKELPKFDILTTPFEFYGKVSESGNRAEFSGSQAAQYATFSGPIRHRAAQYATFSGYRAAQYATFSGYQAAQSATFSGDQAAQYATFSGNQAASSATFSGEPSRPIRHIQWLPSRPIRHIQWLPSRPHPPYSVATKPPNPPHSVATNV